MSGFLVVETDPDALRRMRNNHVTAFVRAREEIIGEARRNAPVGASLGMGLNKGTVQGGLRASITDDGPPKVSTTMIVGRFGSAVRHALMREYGGTIRPVRRSALSWIDPRTGVRFVVGPNIKRNFSKIDKATGQRVVFVRKPFIVQRPGGPRQGYKPFLRPAGEKFPQYFRDHLRAGGW